MQVENLRRVGQKVVETGPDQPSFFSAIFITQLATPFHIFLNKYQFSLIIESSPFF